ncbi:hypothetical protein FDG95_gp395 [Pectobacterium phage vB_PcaM_CBB]|uniref:Uncharacterized protein n=1 Tax=Pectobacterium phage vB_PcaM_CBB TaxID=2772511 RepID=A0A1L2CVX1_9CAUD|nr:hypothetical protein FDG95_gp031 [Pectobacterium phage vB_PcaM_CBB]YP_009595124.1 hypothetical protein FDG95_gp395 [Pectobacterium phage vB_PcaM_CBB]AMM43596.1 hypothetical protein CBB_31 [Pectobacterium phage vB_PcaM_CBB]AMM44147.1 hypothetical protein CBB_584 [Pectobacterium phage vB_PcaM_CBB]
MDGSLQRRLSEVNIIKSTLTKWLEYFIMITSTTKKECTNDY